MRVLVTGGNGSVGRDLVPALLMRGHEVVVLDRDVSALRAAGGHRHLDLLEGAVEDPAAAGTALRGADAVVHLAWSFADDMQALLERDLAGEQALLGLARAQRVKRFVYASSAVVYGKPARPSIDETHPLLTLEGRKPAYGVAKEFGEKLALLAGRSGGPAATVLRFWWAFGSEIGGRHLRDLLRTAASGEPVRVPGECGGSFLSADDLAQGVLLSLSEPGAVDGIFNLQSAYVGWDEIARMAVAATGGKAEVEIVPPARWTGAAFLADAWKLDDALARQRLGYRPRREAAAVRDQLRGAIARAWEGMRAALRGDA